MIQEKLIEREAQFFIMYSSSNDPNFYYATRFRIPEKAFYMVGDDGTELLVVSEMEKKRAQKESKVREIASLSDLGFYEKLRNEKKGVKEAMAETFIELLKTHHARKILIPEEFPSFLYQALMPHFDIEIIENPYSSMRAVKNSKEIERIREVSGINIKAFNHFLKLLKKERDADRLRENVEAYVFSLGYVAENTIIASGTRSSDPHYLGHGKVEQHVIFDIFPKCRKTGYHSDFTRTVVIDEDEEIEDMISACIEAKNKALKTIRDGVGGDEVHNTVCDVLESFGYSTLRQNSKEGFIHSTGHGVGLEVHEKPRLHEGGEVLKSGMVVTVEPGLYYPDKGGVRIEDTVVLKKHECEVLTKYKDYVRLET